MHWRDWQCRESSLVPCEIARVSRYSSSAPRSEVLLDTKRGRFVAAVRSCDFRCRLQHDCCNLEDEGSELIDTVELIQ